LLYNKCRQDVKGAPPKVSSNHTLVALLEMVRRYFEDAKQWDFSYEDQFLQQVFSGKQRHLMVPEVATVAIHEPSINVGLELFFSRSGRVLCDSWDAKSLKNCIFIQDVTSIFPA